MEGINLIPELKKEIYCRDNMTLSIFKFLFGRLAHFCFYGHKVTHLTDSVVEKNVIKGEI